MNASRFFAAVGRFAVRFRWVIVAVWVVGAVATQLLPSLASVTQDNNSDFLPANVPSMRAARLATPFHQANLTAVPILAVRPDGVLGPADTTAISRLQQALAKVVDVSSVHDLGRSSDGSAEQLQVLAAVNSGGPDAFATLIPGLRTAVGSVGLPVGLQVHLAGDAAATVDSQAKSGSAGNRIEGLSALFILILLLFIFRGLLAPVVTLVPAFLVVSITGPLVAESTHLGVKVSSLAQLMMVVLVLGAGADYGLFLIFRFREELRTGLKPKEAVVEAMSRVGESITFSAGTVIAALLSLLAASFGIYSNLGVPLAIGIAVMLLAGLTLLPALLAILGRAVFWPAKIHVGTPKIGLWGRMSGQIVRRPALTLVVGLAVFGLLAIASLGYKPGGFGATASAPAGTDSAAGNAALAKYFPDSAANPTGVLFTFSSPVWADPQPAQQASEQLQNSGLFSKISGPLDPAGTPISPADLSRLHTLLGPPQTLPELQSASSAASVDPTTYQAYRVTGQFISPDGLTIEFATALRAGDAASSAATNAVPALRRYVTSVARSIGATDSGIDGEAPGTYDVSNLSNGDLKTVIPIAVLIIGILLALVMRSLVAPLYLIVSVALSYLSALGVSVLLFIKLSGDGGLTFILPFMMFLFLLALGEDYNILVMTRVREEAHRFPLREAVARALTATGTTVTSAGLVLAGTFLLFGVAGGASGGGSQIRDVGFGLAIGILMDTFLVRTLLVPSTVILLGRWNWWPSRMSRRDHGPSIPVARSTALRSPDGQDTGQERPTPTHSGTTDTTA